MKAARSPQTARESPPHGTVTASQWRALLGVPSAPGSARGWNFASTSTGMSWSTMLAPSSRTVTAGGGVAAGGAGAADIQVPI
jgi:hypothetical protein